MTCIVGIAHEGRVTIGADSLGVAWLDKRVRADRKAFINGELVIGGTTSFRMLQLLQHALTPPPINEGQEPYAYAVKALVPAIRQCFRDGGFITTKDGRDSGGTFLVGFRGRLFTVYDDFQVAEDAGGIAAVGCGEAYALGAMHALSHLPPRDRLLSGLKAAAEFSAGVAPPFHFVELPEPKTP